MLLQKLLPTAELRITDQHGSFFFFCFLYVLHVTQKAFPVWLSTALSPLTYGFLQAIALGDTETTHSKWLLV